MGGGAMRLSPSGTVSQSKSGSSSMWQQSCPSSISLRSGTSWTAAVRVDFTGVPIYSLAIGDTTNSQFMGR